MNNSTRNLKMKKLLIASTALVATAGMASADITISGHAAAGIYSGLSYTKAVTGLMTTGLQSTADVTIDAAGAITAGAVTAAVVGTTATTDAQKLAARNAVAAAIEDLNQASTAEARANEAADLADAEANLAAIIGSAASASGDGVYSSAGVDFTMTGATDNGISFSATVNIDAGTEVDTADMELDGADGGTAGLGAVSMTGTFGTLTFDDAGIDNLYDDDLAAADVSYSTTVGAVSLTVAHDATGGAAANSLKAGYSASGMDFTLTASEAAGAGTSAKVAVAYALNDTVSLSGSTDQAAGKESVQTIGATTTLNGVSVSVSSANDSTWDVDLGYTAGGFALTYGVDETDAWTATATSALGGGATFAAGVSSDNEMYAGVSFAF
jgi:outer membrane protein OmpU